MELHSEVGGASPDIDDKLIDNLNEQHQQSTTKLQVNQLKAMTFQVAATHPLSSNGANERQNSNSAPTSPSSSFLKSKEKTGQSTSSRRPSKSDDCFAFQSRRNTKFDSTNDGRGIYSWGRGGEGQVSDFYDFVLCS